MRKLRTIRSYDLAAVDAPVSGGAAPDASSSVHRRQRAHRDDDDAARRPPPRRPRPGTTTGTGTTTQIGTETNAPNLPNRRYGSRTLRRGMMGTDVEELQNYLTLAGYSDLGRRRLRAAHRQQRDEVPARESHDASPASRSAARR